MTVAVHYACRLALIACATVLVRGAICGSDFQGTVRTALVVLGVFYGLGFVFGELARRVIEEHVQAQWDREQAERTSSTH